MDLKDPEYLIEKKKLDAGDVHNLFRFWERLSESEKRELSHEIENLNTLGIKQQKQLIRNSLPYFLNDIEPFVDFDYAGNLNDRKKGLELIREGMMGCLLLAGGQGSRLGTPATKGMFPISVIRKKSLFQLYAEKVLAAGKQAGRKLPLAIMTSPLNAEQIIGFFTQNNFFGLDADQVFFYSQGMLPLLDEKGNLFLEASNKIAKGPNGNGLSLKEFVKSGISERWKELGVHYLNVIQVDNPLADPFDSELLGFHYRKGVDVTSKSVEKIRSDEKVGVFVKQKNHAYVIEYTEMDEKDKIAKDAEGHLKYRCASLSLFCFSMHFIDKVVESEDLPLHLAWKAVSFVDASGITRMSSKPNAWKFETFIFDVLRYAHKVAALIYPRDVCFAPLKNKEGVDSPQTVIAALQNRDCQIYEEISQLKSPSIPFELSQDFYYPTPNLIVEWKNKKIEKSEYIKPE